MALPSTLARKEAPAPFSLAYISGPLRHETDGDSLRALDNIAVALREVVAQTPAERERPNHILLHNYERSLWDQLLAKLPHRVLRRAVVVSSFYEPDIATGQSDDPPGQAGDTSVFQRLFSDFTFNADAGEAPVTVCFQVDYDETALPLSKLKAWKDRLNLRARLATSDDPRPLHGKLLVLEGTGRKGREPFLVALHGSPNFTSAALLTTPPNGNAELAVLTRLPPRGGGTVRVEAVLDDRVHAAAGIVDAVQRGHRRMRMVRGRILRHGCDWNHPVPTRPSVGLDNQRI